MEKQENILEQLQQLRKLFAETAPTDDRIVNDYAWIIVRALNTESERLGSVECRKLLADYVNLMVKRPSSLHSAILSAAIRIAETYPEFRFSNFLRLWDLQNMRKDDTLRQVAEDGRMFKSLEERTAKALGQSLVIHSQTLDDLQNVSESEAALLGKHRYSIMTMIVTRISVATDKNGRKLRFVTLTSPDGTEVEAVSGYLMPSPYHPVPEGKRHYVDLGQVYNCLIRRDENKETIRLACAYLFILCPTEIFPQQIGYIEAIDSSHGHMHIYDALSRHFVARVQRFSRERVGDFVRFIPIIPRSSKFKSAIILSTVPSSSEEVQSILREIRITHVNNEKGYAAWELVDKERPITELLSPLQLSQGEVSPSFCSGYINLAEGISPTACGVLLQPFSTYKALVYLKRGKDKQKRPHVEHLLPN